MSFVDMSEDALATVVVDDRPFEHCKNGHVLEDGRIGCVICFTQRHNEHVAAGWRLLNREIFLWTWNF